MYLGGQGVAQDDAAAFSLFQRAALHGHTGAQIKLGYMYATGRGTSADIETAYSWLTAASLAGDHRGEELLRSIEANLQREQITRATDHGRTLLPLSTNLGKTLLP